ncbi:MAG TPA: hypothetical protein VLH56_10900 [Dissulfurispiraceae bacterium]|nr:hypothetical protein [Dissulfurispiraceae bacterium]
MQKKQTAPIKNSGAEQALAKAGKPPTKQKPTLGELLRSVPENSKITKAYFRKT